MPYKRLQYHDLLLSFYSYHLQCFSAVSWATEMASPYDKPAPIINKVLLLLVLLLLLLLFYTPGSKDPRG